MGNAVGVAVVVDGVKVGKEVGVRDAIGKGTDVSVREYAKVETA